MPYFDVKKFLNSGAFIEFSDGNLLIGYGARQWMSSPSKFLIEDVTFYFPDFFLANENPWFRHEYCIKLTISELLQSLITFQSKNQPVFKWLKPQKEIFVREIEKVDWKIFKKVVPYQFEKAYDQLSNDSLIYYLINLLIYRQNHPLYIYGFWDSENSDGVSKEGILGATPEVLLRKANDGKLTTMACAGTSRDKDFLISDPKMATEHNYVIKGISESLSPFGIVEVAETKPVSFGPFWHLVTLIGAKVEGIHIKELVEALHPTPALGAFPKVEGYDWLKKYAEKVPRSRFGAPVGVLVDGEFISYVAIRNIQWNNGEIKIGAGCGVVEESVPEEEWNEFRMKIKAIKKVFGDVGDCEECGEFSMDGPKH